MNKNNARFLLLFLVFMFIATYLSAQSCNQFKKRPSRYMWLKKEVFIHRTIILDMGGVSTQNFTRYVSPRNFKFSVIDTKAPRIREIKNLRHGTITVLCWSNDDSGIDSVTITHQQRVLLSSKFVEGKISPFSFNFSEPTTITVEVCGKNTPGDTPGAFQLTAIIETFYPVWIWQYVKIS